MTIIVNGENVEVPATVQTIDDLVQHYKLGQKIIVVEHNKQIIEKESYTKQVIKENDSIEIVNFVGGG
ncbi:sulfur carrier protein ThiS [Bacillus tianshenii]|nr:sulfur carrier protein ThiS [Bacillus tianshenii]